MVSIVIQYILYIILFLIAQAISMWGQYFTLKYPNMGMVESFFKAIPFAWLDWFFMTAAVHVGDKYKLVTPTQDTFSIIIIQFIMILIINKFWLKQEISKSDIITFFIILFGFYVSFKRVVSKLLGYPITKKTDAKKSTKSTGLTESKEPKK